MRTSYESLHADWHQKPPSCHREEAARYVQNNVQRREHTDRERHVNRLLAGCYACGALMVAGLYFAIPLTR